MIDSYPIINYNYYTSPHKYKNKMYVDQCMQKKYNITTLSSCERTRRVTLPVTATPSG